MRITEKMGLFFLWTDRKPKNHPEEKIGQIQRNCMDIFRKFEIKLKTNER